jgi:hypothetical protein
MAHPESEHYIAYRHQLDVSSKLARRWNITKNVFIGASFTSLAGSIAESNSGAYQESTYALYGVGAGIALTIGALTMAGLHTDKTDRAAVLVSEIETNNLHEFAREDLARIVPLAGLMSGKPTRDSE